VATVVLQIVWKRPCDFTSSLSRGDDRSPAPGS
jgi:hypothetical protein